MPARKKQIIAIDSLEDMLRTFLVGAPSDYRYEPTRLQIYPIGYFRSYLRVPMPPSVVPFSYMLVQSEGSGTVQVNAHLHALESRCAIVVHRGSIVSIRSLESTEGWVISFDDSTLTRMLRPQSIERLAGLRAPVALSADALAWIESLCRLLEQQLRDSDGGHSPVSDHLLGALLERLLVEGKGAPPQPIERADLLQREFRQLVFKHGVTEGSVGFYARKMNVSENYLCRCVRRISGRSPKEWIIDVRLMSAQSLLATSASAVAEIATRAGFEDPAYFSRLFRRRFGMTPRAFRRMLTHDSSTSSHHPS